MSDIEFFEEKKNSTLSRSGFEQGRESSGIVGWLIAKKIVRNSEQASWLLLGVVVLFFALSTVLIYTSGIRDDRLPPKTYEETYR